MRARWIVLLVLLAGSGAPAGQGLTSAQVKQAADSSTQLRVVVSIKARRAWVISGSHDTLRSAPVAVGSGKQLKLGSRRWRFSTPVGIRRIESIDVDPVWIRPDWAYLELARQKKARLDSVIRTAPRLTASGDSLVIRGRDIGLVAASGFEPWPIEKDIVIGGVLYMPPLGSPYREQRGVLGPYRLNLGGAIGFHGTLDKASIGKASTHGCMRLHDEDVTWFYRNVPIGTLVFIY